MPIYKMEMTIETVVEADSMEDAIDYAESNRNEVMGDWEPEIVVTKEVANLRDLPSGWDGGCFAYGESPAVEGRRLRDLLPT